MDEKLAEWLHALAARLQYDGTGMYGVETITDIRKAATALTLAQARIRELEAALAPFSRYIKDLSDETPDDFKMLKHEVGCITAGDFRRARQALKEASK